MKIFSRLAMAALTMTSAAATYAEAPAGYYNTCEGKEQIELLTALHQLINPHTELAYSDLYGYYPQTDIREDGTIWDMYSTKHWRTDETCGNYQSIGDCYNKEHSMPKSWFSNRTPMYSDLHHIFPTDGKVNGQRSNYPFGECANGTYLKANGDVKPLGRLGKSTLDHYDGTVFEPDNEYKGDFARAYFYMAACYLNSIETWQSDMLSNTSYPIFSSWACDMLLDWHRKDPVSDKERNRNDAVYTLQGNRNPFVDYPELVEFIWGTKVGEAWESGYKADPVFVTPSDWDEIYIGKCNPLNTISKTIIVQTIGATEPVKISNAPAFDVAPSEISASEANAGAEVTISFTPFFTGPYFEPLSLVCGNVDIHLNVSADCVSSLITEAQEITENSFKACWQYCGDDVDGKYRLDVREASGSIAGYPREVDAMAECYTVGGLNPSTDYTFTVSSLTMSSEPVEVRTADPVPYIDFLFDGKLFFSAAAGEPSEVAEIIIDSENIESDITISVAEPFELSLDRTEWSHSITLTPDENRFYLRMNSATAGNFSSELKAVAGDYVNDDITVSGKVASDTGFLEDFEAPAGEHKYDSYDAKTYYGTACTWKVEEAGIWATDKAYAGALSMRGSKKATTLLEMLSDKDNGIGTISFYAARWTEKESLPVVEIEVSRDGSSTWESVGSASFESADYTPYTFTANVAGPARMRLRQTSGARFNIDNIALSDHSSGVSDPNAERHMWDAVSRGGQLVVTVDKPSIDAAIYATDGTTIFAGQLGQGEHTFDLQPGKIVIVASGDFSRTILIR